MNDFIDKLLVGNCVEILKNIDESEYYIIFDELDEDYRDILNPDRKDGYFELLISLFKACQMDTSKNPGILA